MQSRCFTITYYLYYIMKKQKSNQLSFDFDDCLSPDNMDESKLIHHTAQDYLVFPKGSEERPLFDEIIAALNEINQYLSKHHQTVNTIVFDKIFIQGLNTKEVEAFGKQQSQIKMPSRERIRQIADTISTSLRNGEKVRLLNGVSFKSSLVEAISEYKDSVCGMYVDDSVLTEKMQCMLRGIALILSMNIIEKDTVLPMLTNRFLLSDTISKDSFKQHFLATYYFLQDTVKPVTMDALLSGVAENKYFESISFNEKMVKLLLTDSTLFDVQAEADGTILYSLKYEHLRYHQMLARIIYEKKSITIQDIIAEMNKRGIVPNSFSMSATRKNFPWCVPMGKTLWLYKEDEVSMERIQDVIKRYSEEHIRFSFDEIVSYLKSCGYDMKESSIRNYITIYCRRLNSDRNMFCLIDKVPQEEEALWYKKAAVCNRNREVPYRKKLIAEIERMVIDSPERCVPRKVVRKAIAPLIKEQGININNFYKLLRSTDKLQLKEIDGVTYVCID